MNLHKHLTKANLKQLLKYGFCGGISSALDLAVFFTLNEMLLIPYYYVAPISFGFGAITNYIMQRKLTFKNSYPNKKKQFSFFFTYAIIALIANSILMTMLVEGMHLWPTLAKAIVIPIIGLVNFLVHRKITFGIMKWLIFQNSFPNFCCWNRFKWKWFWKYY